MPHCDCMKNGSPAGSSAAKHQETRAATEVSSSGNIMDRTLANAPANDARLHGRARPCRDCGKETSNDRCCDACTASDSQPAIRPDAPTCAVATCPDLVTKTNRAGKPYSVCGAADDKAPGKLERCPTGHLDRFFREANERALGRRA